MKKLPVILLTFEKFRNLINLLEKQEKYDQEFKDKMEKLFGATDFYYDNHNLFMACEKIISSPFFTGGDPSYFVCGDSDKLRTKEELLKCYNDAFVNIDSSISSEFLYEISLHLRMFEKEGSVTASFNRDLNPIELLIVELCGFNHSSQLNYKTGETFSVINNSVD